MRESFSLVRRISQIGTLLKTKFFGRLVGEDLFGNRYYQERRLVNGKKPARWVLYAGEPEATKIPPEWFSWLHYICDTPLPVVCDQPLPNVVSNRYVWQKPHHPNLTGSEAALMPSGYGLNHLVQGKQQKDTQPYEPWMPEDK